MQAEKLRLLQAIRPVDPAEVVRGQFRGYRAEAGVAPDSRVETFAALRLRIDTWRWADVPFTIRAGKCMPLTATEVFVDLKRPPLAVFDQIAPIASNYFRFRLGPDVVISLGARVKRPGADMRGEATEFVVRHLPPGGEGPYERLLGDAIRSDTTSFTRDDCVEAAWRIVEPALGKVAPPAEYEPGSWGPAAAGSAFAGGEGWHDPKPEETPPC